MNPAQSKPPSVLLIGLGRFGREHFTTWKRLEADGVACLRGVVVRSPQHRDQLLGELDVPVFAGLEDAPLANVDKVDIATPPESHVALVVECLPHADVLVEKPLAPSLQEARKLVQFARRQPNRLMVNHLYRFHPAILRIRQLMARERPYPRMVNVTMINPIEPGVEALEAHLELLHPFDILDMLLGSQGRVAFAQVAGLLHSADLQYAGDILARATFGWSGSQRVRTIEIHYPHKRFTADLRDASVLIHSRLSFERVTPEDPYRPLEASLRAFVAGQLSLSRAGSNLYPGVDTGERVLRLSLSARPKVRRTRPRVAVIGGGIFGVSCAIELSPDCDVVLFERHADLLSEATFHNQWRHHSGFHYPRSLQTVREIQTTRDDFHAVYGADVIRRVSSYYCTSASAVEITRERYLNSCIASGLEFTIADPPPHVLDHSQVNLCIKTDEGVFDFYALRERISTLLASLPNVEVRRHTAVIEACWGARGSKVLVSRDGSRRSREHFDFVVNATYSNLNLLANWLGFPIQPLRFDLCEILAVELPLDPVCVTILDGPFTSIVGTGQLREFLLSHVRESVLRSAVTEDGLPPAWSPCISNRQALLRHCSRYLPVLADAKILGSRYATRAVQAFSEDYDGRPTVITNHGFGCWSVLGGKIVTSVSNARFIARQINP
jgi:predicted dehydrogenase/glycine/D-amino acid oxidase-like deaminating enzyme